MRPLFIITVVLIFLSCLTDEGETLSSNKRSKLRRAFFSKRSLLLGFEDNNKYNCVINLCLPGLEDCTKTTYTDQTYQLLDEVKEEIQEMQCIIPFADCIAKCMNNWRDF